jgi:hypothetical protein
MIISFCTAKSTCQRCAIQHHAQRQNLTSPDKAGTSANTYWIEPVHALIGTVLFDIHHISILWQYWLVRGDTHYQRNSFFAFLLSSSAGLLFLVPEQTTLDVSE